LEDLMQGSGGLGKMVADNPQLLSAVISMLSSRDTSVGGSGGLGSVIDMFQRKGLGDVVSSWISTGPNPPVSADQVSDVFGPDILSQFARKAGVPQTQAGGILASLLPTVIDQLTPQGEVPPPETMESSLGGLLSSFLR
jgi:uncharacterized protein YidB (DUF937 family)